MLIFITFVQFWYFTPNVEKLDAIIQKTVAPKMAECDLFQSHKTMLIPPSVPGEFII